MLVEKIEKHKEVDCFKIEKHLTLAIYTIYTNLYVYQLENIAVLLVRIPA
ncbi:hypothetical protein V1226_22565 [Lachnospiraceae bacterium JLR.KK009]